MKPSVVAARLALIAGLLLLLPAGCKRQQQAATPAPHPAPAPAAPVTKAAPPTPLDVESAELGGPTWNPAWNDVIGKAIPPDLLFRHTPHDVRRFCPRFFVMNEPDKRAFWAYFFEAVASAEAGLNPRANVRHTDPSVDVVDTETHLRSRQAGLLQLKYQDADRYGCDFDWNADKHLPIKDPERTILQPENNLRCGIRILTNQVIAQSKPLISPTSYWAVLRPGTPGYRNFLKQISNPPATCGLRALRSRKVIAATERETALATKPAPAAPGTAATPPTPAAPARVQP